MRSRQRLDLAILGFFQNFRKVYVGEQVMHSSKVYTKLNECIGSNKCVGGGGHVSLSTRLGEQHLLSWGCSGVRVGGGGRMG
jgi:hypothetical protein